MRRELLCATALSVTLLSACGSSGGSPAARPTRSQPPVTVSIGIRYVGGPAPGHPAQLAPGTIHLQGPATDLSRQVAQGRTSTFRVPPGDYTATARSGDAMCHQLKLTAAAGRTSRVLIHCDVK